MTSPDSQLSDRPKTLPIINIAAYKFVRLDDLPQWRIVFRRKTSELQLHGTVLLSHEGINLFVAGYREQVDGFLEWLRQHDEFADLQAKESPGDHKPFNRMLVRLKKEIISMGVPEIDPVSHPSPKISAKQLKQWLDEGREITLLDTRNDYEIGLGTFENAISVGIDHFRQFPEAVKSLPSETRKRPIVVFCTGGIRCEKAGPLMQRNGFEEIYQLDGGILKYFEECGGDHFQGDCFVFDHRVAVDPKLHETGAAVCFACQAVLTPEQQQHPQYDPPNSCQFCFKPPVVRMQQRIEEREEALRKACNPLPGSNPYTNIRPLNVPLKYDGWKVADLLHDMHPHMESGYWIGECELGRALNGDRVLSAEDTVRSGWRLSHWIPDTREPNVNADIRIIHEDARIVVVNKPAPLPMHPSGRFNRNTLVKILNLVYYPEILRPAHRLDANTTGVVVLSRNRATARLVQPQFENGSAQKAYLAVVHGKPAESEFRCDEPIGREADVSGSRTVDAEGLPATTLFRVLGHPHPDQSLIECRPLTGRTNQIRLHLATLGFPIVGDRVYSSEPGDRAKSQVQQTPGTISPNDPPMCLHAWQITLQHPDSNEPITFEAEPPTWAGTNVFGRSRLLPRLQ